VAESRAVTLRNDLSYPSWRFGPLAVVALLCTLLFLVAGCSALQRRPIIRSGPEEESAQKPPQDHPKLRKRVRVAQKILTDEVRKDFHERNERESDRLVCAVLRPPYHMVLLHILGKKPGPEDEMPLDPEKIKSRREGLLEMVTTRLKEEVAPESWDNPNVLIDVRENYFLVFQTLDVVQNIYRYLDKAEKATPLSRTNIRLRVTEAVCDPETAEELRKKYETGVKVQQAASDSNGDNGKNGTFPNGLPVDEQYTVFCVALNGERGRIRHTTPRQYVGDMLPFYSEGQFSIWQERREVKEGSELAFVARTWPERDKVRLHFRYRRLEVIGWNTDYVAGGLIRTPKVDAHETETTLWMPRGRRMLVGGPKRCRRGEDDGSEKMVVYFATVVREEPSDQSAPRQLPPQDFDGPANIAWLQSEEHSEQESLFE